MAAKRKAKDFIPDSRNANKGTVRGLAMLEDSLRKYGAGRSILVDKNNNIIAGNKTHQAAIDLGLDDVIVVPTDGKQLVVVQRVDIDIDSKQGRELAIADNRVGQVDLEFDPDVLMGFAEEGIDLAQYWNDGELAAVLGQGDDLDYEKAWQGMPEYTHEDKTAFQSIHIHFPDAESVQKFAKLIEQSITDHTRSLWFPPQPIIKYGKAHES
jgi:hypothetical protein